MGRSSRFKKGACHDHQDCFLTRNRQASSLLSGRISLPRTHPCITCSKMVDFPRVETRRSMSDLAEIIARNEERIRADWMSTMGKSVQRTDLMGNAERQEQS